MTYLICPRCEDNVAIIEDLLDEIMGQAEAFRDEGYDLGIQLTCSICGYSAAIKMNTTTLEFENADAEDMMYFTSNYRFKGWDRDAN